MTEKNTIDYNNGFNDNYISNDGNFDDNYDKNIQISLVLSKNVPILGTFTWLCQKIRAWVNPPPFFGQCPKENVFLLLMSSLRNGVGFQNEGVQGKGKAI